jgi:hypothetical protein
MDLMSTGTATAELQPGLVVADHKTPVAADAFVRTDVACFVRVRRSPVPLEGTDEVPAEKLWIKSLPGSPAGVHCHFTLRHDAMDEWTEEPFAGEFRTRRPAMARHFLDNGGKTLHLVDVTFTVPPLDPADIEAVEGRKLTEDELLDLAEARETDSLLAFYDWALDRTDTLGGGMISQIVLPEVWTRHVHLLPDVWARVCEWCRLTGNRFLVADCAPPMGILQDEERAKAKADGYTLTEEEVAPAALVPWYRADHWQTWGADVPNEVALTLDALDATRRKLELREETLSFLAVYWPWIQNLRGLDLPPSAAMAGVYARSDQENEPVGVKKSPANEQVKAVFDLSMHIDEQPTNLLRRAGVNVLTPKIGRGVVVWGARTQCEDDSWKFISVRRLIGYIGKQLQFDNDWAVFENNTDELRARVSRDTRYFLTSLWEKGALAGETADEAFRVVCSEENNPRSFVEQGNLTVDLWVNPVQTNEFVHLQLAYTDALTE